MSYQLPPDLEHAFALRVATGAYADIEQALRLALTALDERNQEIAALQAGVDAMERGAVVPLRDFDQEFRATNGIPLDA
jgi:Arc/MetJ-type ribon-helix-helix transcriptional regulator